MEDERGLSPGAFAKLDDEDDEIKVPGALFNNDYDEGGDPDEGKVPEIVLIYRGVAAALAALAKVPT